MRHLFFSGDGIQRFAGKWKQESQNGLLSFLEAQGVGWMKRNLAVECNPIDTGKPQFGQLTH